MILGTCVSLGSLDSVNSFLRVQYPRVLGPGVEEFDYDGNPSSPRLEALRGKIFSGSELDLDASPVGSPGGSTGDLTGINLGNAPLVLVTNGGTFLGAYITCQLLQQGYSVRVLFRECVEIATLRALAKLVPGAQRRLFLYNEVSIHKAVAGCSYVVHIITSSSCSFSEGGSPKKFEEDLSYMLVEEVDNLYLYARRNGVKRVVVVGTALTSGSSSREEAVEAAKIAALKKARQMAVDVPTIVLLPAILIGPRIAGQANDAVDVIERIALAPPWVWFVPRLRFPFTDVRDVAMAVAKALSSKHAVGREYALTSCEMSFAEIGATIKSRFPSLAPAQREMPNRMTLLLSHMGLTGPRASMVYLRERLVGIGQHWQLTTPTKRGVEEGGWNGCNSSSGEDSPQQRDCFEKDFGFALRPASESVCDTVEAMIREHRGAVQRVKKIQTAANVVVRVAAVAMAALCCYVAIKVAKKRRG